MKVFRFILLGIAPLLALSPLVSHAAGGLRARGELREKARAKLEALREDLNLTDAQKNQVKDILMSHKQEILTQWKSGKSAREAMQTAVKEHGASSPEATTAAAGIGEMAKKRALLVASISQEVKPVLTPDQIKKLEAAKAGFEKWLQDEAVANQG